MNKSTLRISQLGLELIADYEANGKPHLKAIPCPEQPNPNQTKYEIGFGHNSDAYFEVTADSVITLEQAYDLLKHDVREAEDRVNALITKRGWHDVAQHEFDAMVMAVFNGVGLDKSANKATYTALCNYFDDPTPENADALDAAWQRWCYATRGGRKVKMRGLVLRRADECTLFFEGDYERTYDGGA